MRWGSYWLLVGIIEYRHSAGQDFKLPSKARTPGWALVFFGLHLAPSLCLFFSRQRRRGEVGCVSAGLSQHRQQQ